MSRYATICVDPPWPKADTGARTFSPNGSWDTSGRGACLHPSRTPYRQMTVAEITALPVGELAEADAHLYLWCFGAYVPIAYRVVRRWGFKASALLTWCKAPMGLGMGGAYVPSAEHILFARRGRDVALRRWPSTWFEAKRPSLWENGGGRPGPAHSAKPESFLDIVEQVSPPPRVELFARRNRLGWDTWGLECLQHITLESSDETVQSMWEELPGNSRVLPGAQELQERVSRLVS